MEDLDETRIKVSKNTPETIKEELGQYLTPCAIADFMASLFSEDKLSNCDILDPGAGMGVLTKALSSRVLENNNFIKSITAVELDNGILPFLEDVLNELNCEDSKILKADFLETALNWIQFDFEKSFSHIIMNPPYKKINSNSAQRNLLHQAGIETVNLYSGFVALGIMLLREHGELVAIIPRSFCNGPYYRPFRNIILNKTQITQIHLFGSRKNNFSDDNVLQENVIIKLIKESPSIHEVKISFSTDGTFDDYYEYSCLSDEIVENDDKELFIRIPEHIRHNSISQNFNVNSSLQSLHLSVSTGPVVDFRVKPFLSSMPQEDTVPLIYPFHMEMTKCIWPQEHSRKANSIRSNENTIKMLYPSGYYCAVKRFSSKEEKHRISACVISPDDFHSPKFFGFENHLNIFHNEKQGLDKDVAFGLMVFLNSDMVDRYFRTFNGHTQVNATDLK
ncbi:MAG: Eco57I restriction-modification methylase domain-containing protein, partial [Victivallales bacterium]|nr:Eco57I restriction-modification methylase domain-containing protein [Victivallales bacterium]